MAKDGGQVWSTKRRVNLYVWLKQISVILDKNSEKQKGFYILNKGGQFQITGEDCTQHCGHNHFNVVVSARSLGFFMMRTGKERGSPWNCMGYHEVL